LKVGRKWFFSPDESYPVEPGVRKYSRFTITERLALEKMLKLKTSVADIAEALGKSPKAVYLEIRHGTCEQLTDELITVYRYCADLAEAQYRENVQLCGSDLKIGNDYEFASTSKLL
jgi:IS30 family transposase